MEIIDHAANEKRLVDAERFEEAGNYRMAARALQRGAAEGNTACQLNLGNYYTAGKGVKKSMQRAAHWYKKAYENGDRSGAFNLAVAKRDQGNIRWAEFWFNKAVAMRDGSAHRGCRATGGAAPQERGHHDVGIKNDPHPAPSP